MRHSRPRAIVSFLSVGLSRKLLTLLDLRVFLGSAAMILFAAAASWAQTTRTFVATRLPENTQPPVIDGRVDDAAWAAIQPYSDFIQQDPTEGAPATERTEVRLAVGERHVYLGTRRRRTASRARHEFQRAARAEGGRTLQLWRHLRRPLRDG
jgi:hypothetical protein